MKAEEQNEFLEKNKYLVLYLISKYYKSSLDDEDLYQEGMIALWKAMNTYNAEKGEWKVYASIYVRNALSNYIRAKTRKKRNFEEGTVVISINDTAPFTEESMTWEQFIPERKTTGYSDIEEKEFFKKLNKEEEEIVKYKLAGYSVREIAKRKGKSTQSIYQKMKTIRKKAEKSLG